MAATLAPGRNLEVGIPVALFPLHAPPNTMADFRSQYVPAPDGKRFLALLLMDERNDTPAVVTLNALGGTP